MSIEKRNNKWMARWRDPDGTQRAKSFLTEQEAKNHLVVVQADKSRGLYQAPTKAAPLAEIGAEWLESAINLSPITLRTYHRDLNAYILPTFGKVRADRIDARMIQKWLNTELKRLAPVTVHRHYRTLRTLFGYAKRMGHINSNPCENVTPPKVGRTEINVLTVEKVDAIADAINPRYRALVLVAAYGGLRWGEAIGLRRMDVSGSSVIVAGQLQNIDGDWVRLEPKWASRRTVTLPASVAAELAAHVDEFTGPAPTDLVFTNEHGKPISSSFRGNVWGPACVKAGLATEEWIKPKDRGARGRYEYRRKVTGAPRFHDLRHTAASLAIATGAHPKAIQARLGHATIAMTMDLYGHLMAGIDEQLATDLDALRGTT